MALKEHIAALELCSYCAKLCRHSCPVSNALGRETLVPQAKMQLLDMLERNATGWSADHVAPLCACTGCRACQSYCHHGNDVAAALWEGRAEAMRRGLAPRAILEYPAHDRMRRERLAALLRAQVQPEWLDPRAKVAYVPGCDTVANSPAGVANAFTLFQRIAGMRVRLLDPDLACAGYPLWAAGAPDEAGFCVNKLLQKAHGIDTLVLECAACTSFLGQTRAEGELAFAGRVLHLSEFLAQHTDALPIKRRHPAAYYHQACLLDDHDPSRTLIGRCVESVREYFRAECCGGGGLVPLTYPEATRIQAQKRLREPQLYGVNVVVTACPGCKRTLQSVECDVTVMDLVDLLAWSTADQS